MPHRKRLQLRSVQFVPYRIRQCVFAVSTYIFIIHRDIVPEHFHRQVPILFGSNSRIQIQDVQYYYVYTHVIRFGEFYARYSDVAQAARIPGTYRWPIYTYKIQSLYSYTVTYRKAISSGNEFLVCEKRTLSSDGVILYMKRRVFWLVSTGTYCTVYLTRRRYLYILYKTHNVGTCYYTGTRNVRSRKTVGRRCSACTSF